MTVQTTTEETTIPNNITIEETTVQNNISRQCAEIPQWMKNSLINRIVGGENVQSHIPW